MTDRAAWLRLATTPGIGATLAARLIERFGSVEAALAGSDTAWREVGLSAPTRRALAEPPGDGLTATEAWLAEDGHHFLTVDDASYPAALAELDPPPPWLYALGDLDLLDYPAIAIVGSRNPTHAGREAAHEFGRALAAAGLVVVSGLARGIDAAAHEGALDADGFTIAVTGTGLDRVYPAANKALAERIAERGLLLSEFGLGTHPARGNFPRRNRVIAGLCTATLVVEAARASGSLITARMASAANREVFALPGSIHNPLARGCHQLIREGAKLVETTDHILEEIAGSIGGYRRRPTTGIEAGMKTSTAAESTGQDDSDELLTAIGHDPVRIDDLVARTGWKADAVSSTLLILELEGRVQAVAGGAYIRSA
ncbi:DNA-processing protein DprA [Salinisphaera hydrothermalis]|uniref:DNA protecting protein DprA n=1 Tax=Salinisphaera hydrothermalis (strain C41B8) TaxID=1304275 RepID=A0A084IRK2_SALHC|nr:DNA-processing protein DprA [Salinisphaera hydrothermalis]KEZ79336.1 DNA protecting protein DprA [Salinisphaera hydrothermalis C41B8]